MLKETEYKLLSHVKTLIFKSIFVSPSWAVTHLPHLADIDSWPLRGRTKDVSFFIEYVPFYYVK